jgi:hypothetical protein
VAREQITNAAGVSGLRNRLNNNQGISYEKYSRLSSFIMPAMIVDSGLVEAFFTCVMSWFG